MKLFIIAVSKDSVRDIICPTDIYALIDFFGVHCRQAED